MTRTNTIIFSIVALVSFILSVWLFAPGSMGNDSLSQWYQVNRIIPIDNWHPPVIVFLWRALNVLVEGPIGLLIFQQVLYWVGIGSIIYGLGRKAGLISSVLGLIVVGFFPVSWFATASVWKDALMISSLLFSVGLLALVISNAVSNRYKPFVIVLVLLGLFFAGATRHNGLLAVMPLSAFMFGWLAFSLKGTIKKVVAVAVAVALLGVASHKVNKIGVEIPYPYLVNQILLWDLAGISIEKGELLIPKDAFVSPDSANLNTLSKHYEFASNNKLVFSSGLFKNEIWGDPAYGKEFLNRSLGLISSELPLYAKVRIRFMKHFVGTGRYMPYLAYIFETKYWEGDDKLDLPIYGMNNQEALNLIEQKLLTLISRFGFYNALPYLALISLQLLVLFVWFVRDKASRLKISFLLAICLSGILYWLPYVVIAPSNDFRYHLWTIEVVVLLLTLSALWVKASTAPCLNSGKE